MFDVKAVDLGDISHLVVGHDGEGVGSGWFLHDVKVKDTTEDKDKEYYFLCDRYD